MRCAFSIFLKTLGIFGGLISSLIILLAIYFTWKMPLHNFNLWMLKKNFQAVASRHPADSKLLLKSKYIGGLYPGASASCNYFVGEFRSAPLPKEEIAATYKDFFITAFERSSDVPVRILFLDSGFFDHHPLDEWQDKLRRSLDVSAEQDAVYLVFASQGGYPQEGDIRCY
jgi:hypothetical protein